VAEPLFRVNALIWVKQFSADRDALKKALMVLEHGAALAIAPEGTRSKTGGLIQGREGAAFLATRANVGLSRRWCGARKDSQASAPAGASAHRQALPPAEGRAKGPSWPSTPRDHVRAGRAAARIYHGVYRGHPLFDEMAHRALGAAKSSKNS